MFNADFESADDEPLVDEEKQKRENEIGNQLYAVGLLYCLNEEKLFFKVAI